VILPLYVAAVRTSPILLPASPFFHIASCVDPGRSSFSVVVLQSGCVVLRLRSDATHEYLAVWRCHCQSLESLDHLAFGLVIALLTGSIARLFCYVRDLVCSRSLCA